MDKKMKQNMWLIAFGVILYVALMNFSSVLIFFEKIVSITLPLLVGFALAFMLSVPMKGFEKLLKKACDKFKLRIKDKLVQILSLILTILSILFVFVLVCSIVIPEIVVSVKGIALLIKDKWPVWAAMLKEYDIDTTMIADWVENLDFENVLLGIMDNAGGVLDGIAGTAASTISVIVTTLLSLVFMFYVLISKNELRRQTKKLLYANIRRDIADKIMDVARLVENTYSKFLSGQCIEAIILGSLMFIAFSIFRLPYAGLIAILTTVCAFIPYVGAFVSCGVGVLLTLLNDPIQAILCFIVYEVVQFIENQFIYPRVVGTSVGLSPLWTFIAVLIGGKLFGIVGILFFIPFTSVIYSLVRDVTNIKLRKRKVNIE